MGSGLPVSRVRCIARLSVLTSSETGIRFRFSPVDAPIQKDSLKIRQIMYDWMKFRLTFKHRRQLTFFYSLDRGAEMKGHQHGDNDVKDLFHDESCQFRYRKKFLCENQQQLSHLYSIDWWISVRNVGWKILFQLCLVPVLITLYFLQTLWKQNLIVHFSLLINLFIDPDIFTVNMYSFSRSLWRKSCCNIVRQWIPSDPFMVIMCFQKKIKIHNRLVFEQIPSPQH